MNHYNIGFVLEQALGHITHASNLQTHVKDDPEIRPHWSLIPFDVTGLGRQIPLYRSNWTVRVGMRARKSLNAITATTRLDALFFHTQVTTTLNLDWVRRIPSVISLDATPLQYDQLGAFYAHGQGPEWVELLKWRLTRAGFDAARHLVTWSAWAKRSLISDYDVPAEKITVVPPGVTVRDWLRPEPRMIQPGAPLKILFVGGNLERKGGLLLLEAARTLRPLGVELHLVTRDEVAPEPGVFVYRSMQPNSPELRKLYQECDIFALPTYGDCLPMVLSEAGAAGLATVTTDVAAISEVVRHDETGLLMPVGDGAALTAALRLLVERPELRLKLGEAAVAHVARHYDTAKNTAQLLQLLKGVTRPAAVAAGAA